MLQKHQRPLNENERAHLSRLLETTPRLVKLSSTLRWFALWFGVLAVCIFLFFKGFFQPGGPSGVWRVVMPITFLGSFFSFYFAYLVASSYFHLSAHVRRFERDDALKIRAALQNGGASILSVTSDHVVVVEEFEDEGSAYIYDLGDGTSLFLRGQEYYPENISAPWPARQFEIVRTSLNGQLIGIFAGNEPVPKIRTVAMAEMPKTFPFSEEPKTETVLPGGPDDILRRLGYQDV